VIPAVEASRLGRRYGRRWALQDCSLSVPAGHVAGLVGPNGAGKTTLLHMAAGLLAPTTGEISIFGRSPRELAVVKTVGFVAQDKPLYPRFTVGETIRLGKWLNPAFDTARTEERLSNLGIPASQRVGRLSGGQRAQVSLAVALGKRPELLLLDEPVANLDPLARVEFFQMLMTEVAATGLTVVLSSHLLADLQRSCDYLVLLSSSRVQIAEETERLVAGYVLATGPRAHADSIAAVHEVVQASYTDRQAILLIRTSGPILDPVWITRPASLEAIVIAYMTRPNTAQPQPLRLATSTARGPR